MTRIMSSRRQRKATPPSSMLCGDPTFCARAPTSRNGVPPPRQLNHVIRDKVKQLQSGDTLAPSVSSLSFSGAEPSRMTQGNLKFASHPRRPSDVLQTQTLGSCSTESNQHTHDPCHKSRQERSLLELQNISTSVGVTLSNCFDSTRKERERVQIGNLSFKTNTFTTDCPLSDGSHLNNGKNEKVIREDHVRDLLSQLSTDTKRPGVCPEIQVKGLSSDAKPVKVDMTHDSFISAYPTFAQPNTTTTLARPSKAENDRTSSSRVKEPQTEHRRALPGGADQFVSMDDLKLRKSHDVLTSFSSTKSRSQNTSHAQNTLHGISSEATRTSKDMYLKSFSFAPLQANSVATAQAKDAVVNQHNERTQYLSQETSKPATASSSMMTFTVWSDLSLMLNLNRQKDKPLAVLNPHSEEITSERQQQTIPVVSNENLGLKSPFINELQNAALLGFAGFDLRPLAVQEDGISNDLCNDSIGVRQRVPRVSSQFSSKAPSSEASPALVKVATLRDGTPVFVSKLSDQESVQQIYTNEKAETSANTAAYMRFSGSELFETTAAVPQTASALTIARLNEERNLMPRPKSPSYPISSTDAARVPLQILMSDGTNPTKEEKDPQTTSYSHTVQELPSERYNGYDSRIHKPMSLATQSEVSWSSSEQFTPSSSWGRSLTFSSPSEVSKLNCCPLFLPNAKKSVNAYTKLSPLAESIKVSKDNGHVSVLSYYPSSAYPSHLSSPGQTSSGDSEYPSWDRLHKASMTTQTEPAMRLYLKTQNDNNPVFTPLTQHAFPSVDSQSCLNAFSPYFLPISSAILPRDNTPKETSETGFGQNKMSQAALNDVHVQDNVKLSHLEMMERLQRYRCLEEYEKLQEYPKSSPQDPLQNSFLKQNYVKVDALPEKSHTFSTPAFDLLSSVARTPSNNMSTYRQDMTNKSRTNDGVAALALFPALTPSLYLLPTPLVVITSSVVTNPVCSKPLTALASSMINITVTSIPPSNPFPSPFFSPASTDHVFMTSPAISSGCVQSCSVGLKSVSSVAGPFGDNFAIKYRDEIWGQHQLLHNQASSLASSSYFVPITTSSSRSATYPAHQRESGPTQALPLYLQDLKLELRAPFSKEVEDNKTYKGNGGSEESASVTARAASARGRKRKCSPGSQNQAPVDGLDSVDCSRSGELSLPPPSQATGVKADITCPICFRVFTRSWLLKGHMRTHTGERPFRCSYGYCDKAFADKSNLRSHMLTHISTSKSFPCPKCGRAFSQKRYLHKHMIEVCRIKNSSSCP